MEKRASTNHEILDLLARRWSTRAFAGKTLDWPTLARLFEAARWAPSSGNGQPWSFLYALKQECEEFDKLASVLVPGNAWAKEAGALVLSVAQLDREPGKPNRHAWHDVGLATENLMIQATSMDVAVHAMGGFDGHKARELFAIPERWDPVAMLAIGFPGDPEQLNEDLKKKDLAPRLRRPVEEFVFQGKWGERR